MELFTLNRIYLFDCTIGNLTSPRGQLIAHSLELPWKNNSIDEFCIPARTYVVKCDNKSKDRCYYLYQVEGRTDIYIRPGPKPSDSLAGSIWLGILNRQLKLTNGAQCLGIFLARTNYKDFILKIA